MPLRALIFAAVSTAAQATEDKASLDEQVRQCRTVCDARGWAVTAVVRVEGHSRDYSWLHQLVADCPAYGDFIAAVESGDADLVVVRDYDRLWRTDALRAQVTTLCREHHVQVFSCNQPVEPVDPALLADTDTARLSEVLFGFIAEQENRARVRRVRMGTQQRILRRGLAQAGRLLYGYQRGPDADSPMTVYEPEAVHVRWMFARRAEGWGYHRIADALEARGARPRYSAHWLPSTVRRMLCNETYTGVAHWGGARNPDGAHEGIVDADTFRRAQSVSACHTMLYRPSGNERLLTGLVKCGECGWGAGYVPTGDRWLYMRCTRRAQRADACTLGGWRAADVERYVLDAIRGALANPAAWEQARRAESDSGNGHAAARLAALDAARKDADAWLQRWNDLYEAGGISATELLLHRQEIRGQTAALDAERGELTHAARAIEHGVTQLAQMADVLGTLDALPLIEQRQIVRALVARVRLHETPSRHIEIDWW